MSKIFCEICGTAYAYTAKQCPICGCPKPESAEFSVDTEEYAENTTRNAPVKGGRFSKENVNKRLKTAERDRERREPEPRMASARNTSGRKTPKKKKSASKAERSLIIAIICLLLAIVAVMAYILIHYFVPRQSPDNGTSVPAESTESVEPTESTVPPTTQPQQIHCTGLTMTEESIQFKEIGKTWQLSVVPTPADTTDTIVYTSSDPNVATVSEDGLVTAVGEGECVITITCGTVTVECQVTCQLPQPTEPPETEPPTVPVDMDDFKLNRSDFTLAVGESWLLYTRSIDVTLITWTSSNENVATVVDGVVKGVRKGSCIIYAELNGVKLECVVYVN